MCLVTVSDVYVLCDNVLPISSCVTLPDLYVICDIV